MMVNRHTIGKWLRLQAMDTTKVTADTAPCAQLNLRDFVLSKCYMHDPYVTMLVTAIEDRHITDGLREAAFTDLWGHWFNDNMGLEQDYLEKHGDNVRVKLYQLASGVVDFLAREKEKRSAVYNYIPISRQIWRGHYEKFTNDYIARTQAKIGEIDVILREISK